MTTAGLDLRIDKGSMDKAMFLLGGIAQAVPKVTARAINKTLVGVRTDSVREIRKEITPKATVIRKRFHIRRATVAKLSARVESRGRRLGLIHYRARQTRKGVTYQIRKKDPRKAMGRAIIVAPRGVMNDFSRLYKGPRRPVRANKKFYGALPDKYRLPIWRETGPAVPDIMEEPHVMGEIMKKANVRLDKNFAHETDYMLSTL